MRKPVAEKVLLGAWVLALFLVVLGVVCFRIAYKEAIRQEALRQERLLAFDADLTKAGEYRGQFSKLDPTPCGIIFCLDVEPPYASRSEAYEAFVDFEATLTIEDSQGKWLREEYLYPILAGGFVEQPLLEGSFFPFVWPRDSTYTVKLNVTEPAPVIAGRTQKVIVLYFFGGLEAAHVGIPLLAGLASILLSLLLALTVFLLRRRWRRKGILGQPT